MRAQDLVKAFYGRDPIAGEDARTELLRQLGDTGAVETLIPMQSGGWSRSVQSELRLRDLGRAAGPKVAPYLTKVIREGAWFSKQLATPCFSGFDDSDALSDPLIDILKRSADFDAERM